MCIQICVYIYIYTYTCIHKYMYTQIHECIGPPHLAARQQEDAGCRAGPRGPDAESRPGDASGHEHICIYIYTYGRRT